MTIFPLDDPIGMRLSTLVMMGWVAVASQIAAASSRMDGYVPLLAPRTDHPALRSLIYATFPRPVGRWGAVHVVDRSCPGSRSVVAHLIERRALAALDELVFVVDEDGATRRDDIELVHAGYRVRVIPRVAASTAQSAVATLPAPALIIVRPDGSLAYVGGHRRGIAFVDTTVATDLLTTNQTMVVSLIMGCVGEPRVHKL